MKKSISIAIYQFIAVVFIAVFFGGVVTHLGKEAFGRQKLEEVKEYKELTSLLIEIRAASAGGVSKNEWDELSRKANIAVAKYKVTKMPNPEEIVVLDGALSYLRETQNYWALDTGGYQCSGKSPSKECIAAYAKELQDIASESEISYEERVENIGNLIKEKEQTLDDHRSGLVSLGLTLTSMTIDDFFEIHGIDL